MYSHETDWYMRRTAIDFAPSGNVRTTSSQCCPSSYFVPTGALEGAVLEMQGDRIAVNADRETSIAGVYAGEATVELDQQHPIDTTIGNRLNLLAETCQTGRRLFGTEKLHRLGFKGDYQGR